MSTSEAMKARWADPITREALLEARAASPSYQNRGALISARAKERWSNPEFRARMSEIMKAVSQGRVGSAHSTPVTLNGVQYPSIAEAARKTGLSRHAVIKIHNGGQQ